MKETKASIILENNFATLEFSKKDATLESVLFKSGKREILAEKKPFFTLCNKEKEEIAIKSVTLKDDTLVFESDKGNFEIEVKEEKRYFTFELKTALSKDIYCLTLADALYNYDEKEISAVGLPITFWINPVYPPDPLEKKTIGKVFPHLRDVGAKYALIISDTDIQLDILKEACETIDKETGIISKIGGPYTKDNRIAFGNYVIDYASNSKFLKEKIPFYKSIGVDQIDFHHNFDENYGTFRTGDFRFVEYVTASEFKKNVADLLEENGMSASLHTYSHYVDRKAEWLLCEEKYLNDLVVTKTYTLKEAVTDSSNYLVFEEDISDIKTNYGFYSTDCPYFIIGSEIIATEKTENGLKIIERNCSGTKKANHPAGSEVKRPFSFYGSYYPKQGSELFYEVARRTAKAYNEGGFKMIYLDAMDSLYWAAGACKEDGWYWETTFINEVLKHCDTDPILEDSCGPCYAVWAASGRRGAFDSPLRAYKLFTNFHEDDVLIARRIHQTATMGWYDFYPQDKSKPGNYHTKYQHFDDIDHIGTIAVCNDFSMVPNNLSISAMKTTAAVRRNYALYQKYDEVRKSLYFSEEYRKLLEDRTKEYALVEKRGKKYSFVEKDYKWAKLYDLSDEGRNCHEFKNPFGAQTPFIRIEAMLSSKGENPFVVFPLDETKALSEIKPILEYPTPIDLSNNLALKVKIEGNGKKGSAVAIKMRSANDSRQLCEYFIETDYKGEREFILIETDTGSRPDLPFDDMEGYWTKWGTGYRPNAVKKIEVLVTDEAKDVKMSSIVACEELYDILKNPKVKIGDSEITFHCELTSSDYIEFDGKSAKVFDRFGNEKEIFFEGNIRAPRGRFKATLTAKSLNRMTPRAKITLGFTGKEIKITK